MEQTQAQSLISVEQIYQAKMRLKGIAEQTPLLYNPNLSERYGATIFLKREDLQVVRSYKIRGAYNKMVTTDREALENGNSVNDAVQSRRWQR